MLGSLIIVGFFVLGVILAYFGFIPEFLAGSHFSFYALCALMFCVGFSIGIFLGDKVKGNQSAQIVVSYTDSGYISVLNNKYVSMGKDANSVIGSALVELILTEKKDIYTIKFYNAYLFQTCFFYFIVLARKDFDV